MSYYLRRGEVPHKRHTHFRQPDGSLYHEEVMGIHGFAGIQSLLYHLRPPTAIPHGPHPGACEGSIGRDRTDELAVMVDTFRPLRMTVDAAALEDETYASSWSPAAWRGAEGTEGGTP